MGNTAVRDSLTADPTVIDTNRPVGEAAQLMARRTSTESTGHIVEEISAQ